MKITDITWEKLHIDLLGTFKIAFTEINYSEVVLIKVTTDEGITGYGEAAPFAPVTGETADSVIAVLKMLKPGLIGMDPFCIEQIHSLMDQAIYSNGAAKCAVDLAMYDLMGKASGQPVYKLLGGYQKEVQNDITLGIGEPEETAKEAERCVKEEGFHILKIKTGIDPDADIRTINLIREKVGPEIRLRVDANQGYDIARALYAIEGFKKAGVEAVEQCLPYWDHKGMAELRAKVSGIQLMMDESVHDPKDAAALIREGCADVLNIKLMKCGGLLPGLKISDVAEASGVTCMVGCMLETKLAITAGVSLVAARKNITEADCDSFMFYKDSETGMSGGFERKGDRFILLDKPGFGVDINF